MNKTRFDLEQEIMQCWQVVDDLKTVYNAEHLYKDENEMQNVLLGLQSLYTLKFNQLFNTFESLVHDGDI